MQWIGSRASLSLLWVLVASCGTSRPARDGSSGLKGNDLEGCYQVDEQIGDGLNQVGERTLLPKAFEAGALFCLDSRGFFVKPSERDTTSHWYRIDSDWQVQPIRRRAEQVGVIWTSDPAIVPDPVCRREPLLVCCVAGGCEGDVPEVAFRFTQVKTNLRVALADESVSVSLVPLSESRETSVRREIAATRVIEQRGPRAPERAIQRRADRRPPDPAPGGYTIDLDEKEPQPPKKALMRCPKGEELVAEACIAYCPPEESTSAGGSLSFNSIPQSWVLLDGCLLGQTPQIKRPVPTGAHEVIFVHDERGRILRRVEVRDKQTRTVAVKFQ